MAQKELCSVPGQGRDGSPRRRGRRREPVGRPKSARPARRSRPLPAPTPRRCRGRSVGASAPSTSSRSLSRPIAARPASSGRCCAAYDRPSNQKSARLQRSRRPAAPPVRVDGASGPRERPFSGQSGGSGRVGFPIRARTWDCFGQPVPDFEFDQSVAW